jgi:hypothetical protein
MLSVFSNAYLPLKSSFLPSFCFYSLAQTVKAHYLWASNSQSSYLSFLSVGIQVHTITLSLSPIFLLGELSVQVFVHLYWLSAFMLLNHESSSYQNKSSLSNVYDLQICSIHSFNVTTGFFEEKFLILIKSDLSKFLVWIRLFFFFVVLEI